MCSKWYTAPDPILLQVLLIRRLRSIVNYNRWYQMVLRMKTSLWKDIFFHLWDRYFIIVNQVVMASEKCTNNVMTIIFSQDIIDWPETLYQNNSYRLNGLWRTLSTKRDKCSICRCCHNVPSHERKVSKGKIAHLVINLVSSIHLNCKILNEQTFLFLE